jgi:glycosyltransferase involved in cell wall biosynthesis
MPDLTVVITAHREAAMAGVTVRSASVAVQRAVAAGLEVERLLLLDNPDRPTQELLAGAVGLGWQLHEVSFADQGLVRNHATALSSGRYLAFLDGDDLWSENWLTAAYEVCESDPGRVIAHPEVDWFFGSNNNLFFHMDQQDADFDPMFLRVGNYWDALCMAPREAHALHPYSKRAIADGLAYEDWLWNVETMDAGFVHRVVEDTIHFKRRRGSSQTLTASANKSLTRPHPFFTYAWAEEHEAAGSARPAGAAETVEPVVP